MYTIFIQLGSAGVALSFYEFVSCIGLYIIDEDVGTGTRVVVSAPFVQEDTLQM